VVATANAPRSDSAWFPSNQLNDLNFSTAKLLTRLKLASYSRLDQIGKSVGLSEQTISLHVRKLEKIGIAKRRGDSARLIRSTKIPFTEVTAFEIKVSDWRHGLYQATHYKSFANRVVLALPDAKARVVAAHKRAFHLFGVGLVGLSRADGITWYVKAVRRTPSSASRTVLGILEILKSREARFLHPRGKF
jgi:hypothetical protein